ncbi:MAG: sigma-70 family RNA polymerase sigma factor [Planctomycetes bacterium]|nr:sigma-70 family RNA polymerase sigma factor [Planctomycetota bacterium]
MTEAELQIRLMEREEAIHNFVERRIPRGVRSVVSAEDVLQEIWFAAYKSAKSLAPEGSDSLERWLYAVAKGIIISRIRHARRLKRGGAAVQHRVEARSSSWLELFPRLRAPGRSPSSEQGAKEAAHAVKVAIDSLPQEYRQAVTLHHIKGMSRAQIAEAMRKSPAAVHGILYRGLATLRRSLGPVSRFFSDARDVADEGTESASPTARDH